MQQVVEKHLLQGACLPSLLADSHVPPCRLAIQWLQGASMLATSYQQPVRDVGLSLNSYPARLTSTALAMLQLACSLQQFVAP